MGSFNIVIIGIIYTVTVWLYIKAMYTAFCFNKADNILYQLDKRPQISSKSNLPGSVFPKCEGGTDFLTQIVWYNTFVAIAWAFILAPVLLPGSIADIRWYIVLFQIILLGSLCIAGQFVFLSFRTVPKVNQYYDKSNFCIANYLYSVAIAISKKHPQKDYINALNTIRLARVTSGNIEKYYDADEQRQAYIYHLFYLYLTKPVTSIAFDLCKTEVDFFSATREKILSKKDPYASLTAVISKFRDPIEQGYPGGDSNINPVFFEFTKAVSDACNIVKQL